MIGRTLLALTCAMAISLGVHAQSGWRELAASEEWMLDFTVLTMYRDAWGSATEPTARCCPGTNSVAAPPSPPSGPAGAWDSVAGARLSSWPTRILPKRNAEQCGARPSCGRITSRRCRPAFAW
jgi:hypothetical protein